MNIIRKFLKREAANDLPSDHRIDARPLAPIATPKGHVSDIADVMASPEYAEIRAYFSLYPGRSLMSDHSRALLYSLVRLMHPQLIAEIGTLHAGTTEVFARALWENGGGVVHTADPYGGERCPAIISQWPVELQRHAHFAEQTGPFKASQLFLANNREWRELGSAVASHARSAPFDNARASVPGTSFVILQAPDLRSWGQVITKSAHFDGIRLDLPAQRTSGWLHYQAVLRAFHDDGSVPEQKAIGKVRIEVDSGATIAHSFDQALRFPEGHSIPTKSTSHGRRILAALRLRCRRRQCHFRRAAITRSLQRSPSPLAALSWQRRPEPWCRPST